MSTSLDGMSASSISYIMDMVTDDTETGKADASDLKVDETNQLLNEEHSAGGVKEVNHLAVEVVQHVAGSTKLKAKAC